MPSSRSPARSPPTSRPTSLASGAYFDYVNASGGVNGRQLDLAYPLDDASNPTTDITDAQTLVNADKAFAIVGVSTPFFNAHKFLATTSTPVFGYATGNVWGGPKNFFADYGSVLNFNSSIPFFAYVAKETKSTKVAVIALNYPASQDECKGALTGLKKYKFKVAYSNINEPIGANWSIEATKMRDAHANMSSTAWTSTATSRSPRRWYDYGIEARAAVARRLRPLDPLQELDVHAGRVLPASARPLRGGDHLPDVVPRD